jgi:hypothetical protein
MTYIELINNFWFLDEDWQFTCCETRLYFYLLKTANRLGWVDSWTRSDTKVASDVGVSVNSMKTARNRLVQAGLITFKAGGNGQRDKTKYQVICEFRCQNLIPKVPPNLEPNPIPNLEPKVQPYNKTKTKNNNNNSGELFPPEEKPKKKKSAKVEFIPPTLDQIKAYFEGKLPDWERQAEIFFYHFDALNWKNTNGARIERWDSRANLWIIEKQLQNGNKPTTNNDSSSASFPACGGGGTSGGDGADATATELEDWIDSLPIGR